jgi:cysteine-rich repeat protein
MSGITWRGVACFTALLCVLGVHGQLRSYFFCQGGDQDGFSCQGLADVVTCGSNGTCIEDAYVDPCGNGYRLFQEECDDGNVVDGDGCSSTCKVEKGWRCDMDSAGREPDTCTVICGDGIQRDSGCCAESECSLECDARRGCDDGNTVRDDGCSEQCSIETAFSCWGGDINTTSTCLCSRSRVSAGATHTCAISSLNKLQCWGDPKYGKTITKCVCSPCPRARTSASHTRPTCTRRRFPEGTKVATDVWPEGRWMDLDVWVSVNSGSEHNCALKYDGTAMCWGWRGLSKVGDGRIRLPSTPDWERDSQGGYTWRQLALGDAFSCGCARASRPGSPPAPAESPPPSLPRTNRTSLVSPPVLTGRAVPPPTRA